MSCNGVFTNRLPALWFLFLSILFSAPATAGDILIYGPSMSPPSPENEQTLAEAAGHTVTVVGAAAWSAMTTAQFASYDAIVFGDPTCATGTGLLAAAEANKATWSAAITGHLYVQGTDPIFHQYIPTALELVIQGIDFAASGPGTGLYASLSCYYHDADPGTQVSFLSAIGDFRVAGQEGCPNEATVVAPTHPAMTGITSAGLSDWGCSVHDFLVAFPSSLQVLATAIRSSDGASLAYIVASPDRAEVPVDIKPGSCPNPINVKSKGVLPVAVLGTADLDVRDLDVGSLRLLGVAPLRTSVEDVATPFEPFVGKAGRLDCTTAGADGFPDLTLKFSTQEIVAAIEATFGPVPDGTALVLPLEGALRDGTAVIGEDVVVILRKGRT